jgi:hypothetical protein
MCERGGSVRARDHRDRRDHGPGACGGAPPADLRQDRVQAIFYMSHENSKKKRKEEKKNKRAGVRSAWRAPGRGRQAAPRAGARPTAAGTMVPMVLTVPGCREFS